MNTTIKYIVIIAFLLANVLFAQGGQPQIYIDIKDYQGGTFRYHAIKEGNEPIYNHNYNYTHDFDDEYDHYEIVGNDTTIISFTLLPDELSLNKGFEWEGYYYDHSPNR